MKNSLVSAPIATGRPAAVPALNADLVAATLRARAIQNGPVARAAQASPRRYVQAVDGCIVPIEEYSHANYEGYQD